MRGLTHDARSFSTPLLGVCQQQKFSKYWLGLCTDMYNLPFAFKVIYDRQAEHIMLLVYISHESYGLMLFIEWQHIKPVLR